MDDRNNTIAGWVLFGGIAALGLSIVTGMYFAPHRPETMGYVVEGVEQEGEAGGAEAEPPIAAFLATASAARGEAQFKKCAACHTVTPGGANGIGPNIYGVLGKAHGHLPNFQYSDALKSVPGNWDWDSMSAWLKSPKSYAPGTRMSFAGLSKPQDRADLLLYLNAQGSNLPVPPPPAEEAAEEEPANAVEAVDDVAVSEEAPAGGSPAGAASVGLPTGATTDQAAKGN
ncbi:cytochrome c family protein [Tardibacter chloracetimidivorans]|uniref:Cytochrome c family protein n=1 Tax=Tardibacter chloracetimidivorans TaxID=1921510 RepID=A0A1L3ZQN3_9SPHN|nr:cytochrome c family protein [Tardibacter chloracetimidivorans]API57936.1 cytochrome c family protein [Tardibacter chloracetimidivorans]